MLDGRAESRTERGWQRFDRVAGLVALLLMVALLILWFSRTEPAPTGTTVLSAVQSTDTPSAPTVSAVDNTGEEKLPQTNSEATSAADVKTESQPDRIATVKPAQPVEPEKPVVKSKPAEPVKPVKAKVDVADSGAIGTDQSKSLASQDPANQATFERIPKYIDKSITAAGSLANAAGASANPAQAEVVAATVPEEPRDDDDAAADASTDAQRSATTLAKQVPKVKPVLELSSVDGRLSIDGIVSSDQVRAAILKAGLQSYGMRNLTDRLSVNVAVEPFDWADDASDLIVLIGGPDSQTTLRIDGNVVTLTGEVNELQDKQARALAAQQLFGTRARIDNRLRVVPKQESVVVAAKPSEPTGQTTSPTLTKPVTKPIAKPLPKSAQPVKPAPSPQKPANQASDSAEQALLAEGGPGQVDKVVLNPRGLPAKFSRGECPRVATAVRIRFRSASTDIPDAGKAYLDKLRRCMRARNYVVGGHTDSRGAALNNLILSQARAQAVVDYLVSIGVPATRVSAKGFGESTPVDSNRSERGRARNRRIDFRFKKR